MEPGMVWPHHGQPTTAWDCHWDAEREQQVMGPLFIAPGFFQGGLDAHTPSSAHGDPPVGPLWSQLVLAFLSWEEEDGWDMWRRDVFFFSPKGEKQMICNSKQLHLCYLRKEKYTLAHGSGKQLRKRANITHYSQFLGCISWLHSFTSLGAVSLEAVLALRFVLMLSRTRTKQHIIKPTLKEQVTESCPWHSQLARGEVILPCEIILTSIK